MRNIWIFQMLCERIFSNTRRNFYTGLLRNPPTAIKEQLTSLLTECAELMNDNVKYTQQVWNGLREVLQGSV